MEIIKELNLSRNPQAVKNGSLVNAWNIKLSKDGTYITADDSLHDVIENSIDGNIVGVIPCNKEFVVFTNSSKIYRFKETDDGEIQSVTEIGSAWSYSGSGIIKGTYSYNINGELIVVISNPNGNRVPLKTINLDKCSSNDNEDQYTPSPNIPIVNMTLLDRIPGTPIPQGLYYFFIRFKCQDETYTNWFPVGVPQYAIAKRPINVSLGTNISAYRGDDVVTTLLNNIKFDCPYGFKFSIKIKNNSEYNKAQLGYILQHDNGTFGRKWHEIDLTNTGNDFELLFDAIGAEEEDVVSLLESPVGLFDVNAITSYENRVYIAGYKETNYDVEEAQLKADYADKINVKQYISDAEKFLIAGGSNQSSQQSQQSQITTTVGEVKSYDYRIKIVDTNGNEHLTTITVGKDTTIINLWNYSQDDALYKIRECIRNAVFMNSESGRFNVTYLTGNNIESQDYPGSYYHEIGHYYLEKNSNPSIQENLLFMKIPIDSELNVENRIELCNENGVSVPCYEFFDFDGRLKQEFSDYQTGTLAGHLAISNASDSRAGYWINGAVEDQVQYSGYFDTILGYFLRCIDMTITKVAIHTTEGTTILPEDDTSLDTDKEHRKYNIRIPNAVRSLMPNEVYSFFVHYVRADGSYTNGIELSNKNASTSIQTEEQRIDRVDIDGTDISEAVEDFFPSMINLKNCELYTYNINENTLTDFALYTNINNKKLFYTCDGYVSNGQGGFKICKIVPIFQNVKIPSGYVGVFFSYAKVDPLNLYYAYTRGIPENNHLIEYKAGEVETGVCTYVGSLYEEVRTSAYFKIQKFITNSNIYISNKPGKEFNESKSYDTDINNRSMISTFGLEGCIGLNVFKVDFDNDDKVLVGAPTSALTTINVRRHDNSIYSDKNVPLISLGQILYGNNTDTYDYGEIRSSSLAWEEFNYPSFICRDKIFTYKNRCFIADNGDYYNADYAGTLTKDANEIGNLINIITTSEVIKHSNFNLDALTVKKEPEIVVRGNESGIIGSYYIVKPINMSDLLQYPGDFLDKAYKSYTINDIKRANYNSRNSVIRRSNVLADESLENTWRYFNSIDYKVFPRDKGAITNLIGLGYYFLVHTEHTLFSIDRNNLLKGSSENVQVATPTTFDVEPKEMFTSSHGYGGLQTDSWTVNHCGYFFYDKDSVELYNVDNGNLTTISLPIKKLLTKFNPTDASIVTDFDNNRIIICFKNASGYLTISYNLFSKTFISLHSFKFDYSYNTKNRLYIRLDNSALLGTTNIVNNTSVRTYGTWLNNSNGGGLVKVSAATYGGSNSFMPSIIEVIFNFSFEKVKTLNFINWIVKLIQDWDNSLETNMSDEENYYINEIEIVDTLNRKYWYSGEILRIYTDLTDSLDLDIEITDKVNIHNNYKYPYFDRGNWNLNYFRNHLAQLLSQSEKDASKGKGSSVPAAVRSDNRGLLYGRYIVARFVFGTKEEYNLPFRFNNVNIG